MNNWNKKNVKNINNWQITCASDAEEFFYEDTNEVVPEGEAIGIEVEESNNIVPLRPLNVPAILIPKFLITNFTLEPVSVTA